SGLSRSRRRGYRRGGPVRGREGLGAKAMTDTTPVLLALGAVLAVAAGVWVYFRLRAPREEPYYHFRCPRCRRRLRYRQRPVGHSGRCSNCGGGVTFPPVSESIA